MTYLYCDKCQISCPSDYQMQQHLRGRKHAQNVSGYGNGRGNGYEYGGNSQGGIGVCFQFQKTGTCTKGAMCTYKHVGKSSSAGASAGAGVGNARSYSSSGKQTSTGTRTSHYEDLFDEDEFFDFHTDMSMSTVNINMNTNVTATATATSRTRSGPAPPGTCFLWWKNGVCTKGYTCTYKHDLPQHQVGVVGSNIISPAPVPGKRPRDQQQQQQYQEGANSNSKSSSFLTAEFYICKTDKPDQINMDAINTPTCSSDEKKKTTAKKLASIFCQPVNNIKKEKKSTGKKFPEEYRNLFHRKRNVNLFIQNGLVVWEFAYNTQVIRAIKEHIKGRAWNPSIGIGKKGCWTCPLESLPDAIALYEHMGRTASSELTRRSKEIQEMFGGSSASDAIKASVEVSLDKFQMQDIVGTGSDDGDGDSASDRSSFGSVSITFLYDADIVESVKMLAPTQRTFDPMSKAWKIDLLALPQMLENLLPLGYNAPKQLRKLASLTNDVVQLMHGTTDEVTRSIRDGTKDEKNEECTFIENAYKKAEPNEIIVIEDSDDDNDEDEVELVSDKIIIRADPPKSIENQANILEAKLKEIVDVVVKNGEKVQSLDVSNCGSSKKRKMTTYKKSWKLYSDHGNDNYDSHTDDSYGTLGEHSNTLGEDDHQTDLYTKDIFSAFAKKTLGKITNLRSKSVDCGCGRPYILEGGRHTCRYFGTFECACGNRWTSAYCWEGEMQACRSCQAENFPVRKDKLDGRASSRGGTGVHDSSNCGRCRTLGYSCTGW